MRAYLAQMHESLKYCSEKILTVGVYYTPPATVQLWESPYEQIRRPEEYNTG